MTTIADERTARISGFVAAEAGDNETINGTDGDDDLSAGGYRYVIIAGGGNDFITAGGEYGVVYGNLGDDYIEMADLRDDGASFGGQGNDTIFAVSGGAIYGNLGDDVLTAYDSSLLTIYGGQGADTIVGGYGMDRIFGNRGDDHIDLKIVDGAADVIFMNSNAGFDDVRFFEYGVDKIKLTDGASYSGYNHVDGGVQVNIGNAKLLILGLAQDVDAATLFI